MLKHNLILIYRNFLRAKSYFFINLFGLTTGLVCTLLIYLWVRNELNMNKFHEKDARMYQVMEHQKYADEIMTTTSTPGILSEALKQEMPEVEFAATTAWITGYTLSVGEHSVKAQGYHVGEDYFSIYSFKLLQGQPEQVLKDKLGMVISKDLAIKLFGTDENVLGKFVELQHKKTYHVTGVFAGTPPNSSLKFDFVMSFEDFKTENTWVLDWGNNGPSTIVVLKEGTDPVAFEQKIAGFVKTKNEDTNVTLFIAKYSDRYLFGSYENGKQSGGRIEYVRLFSIIAVFILIIACINFMNLSTARASRKAKEVGIKKSVGAERKSLVIQFLSESMVTAILSLILAIAFVYLFLPQFNVITDKHITLNIFDPELILSFLGITIFTGLAAGSYPALYLSGFKPAAVLKGEVRGSWGELWARKGLVIFQFALSVILIVSVLVIFMQIDFVQSKNLGYKKDNLISFPIEGRIDSTRDTFIEEIKKLPGILNASSISHSLMGRNSNTSGLNWDGKNPDDVILFENVNVNNGITETMGMEFVDGTTFTGNYGIDTTKIIFNEAAVRVMNMENPVGKTITLWGSRKLQIIGVVKDFNFQSLHEVVNPLFFRMLPEATSTIMVRLEGGKEKEALESLTEFYKEYNPGFTFDYVFQDQEYARLYAAEQRVATLSGYFAAFAVLISCLGLFGLAAFTAERRLKEIGIRKALGSSSASIVILLSSDFTRMVIIAIIIGLPISYYMLERWLEKFAFHIDLELWYFALAGFIALFISWITVASQAVKASRVNPVDCLKDE